MDRYIIIYLSSKKEITIISRDKFEDAFLSFYCNGIVENDTWKVTEVEIMSHGVCIWKYGYDYF